MKDGCFDKHKYNLQDVPYNAFNIGKLGNTRNLQISNVIILLFCACYKTNAPTLFICHIPRNICIDLEVLKRHCINV